MFPSEVAILISVDKAGGFSKTQLTRTMDIVGEYVGYLYDSLIRRGFIEGSRLRGYQLTSKGKSAILEFLSENETDIGQDKGVATLQPSIGVKR